MGPLGIERWTWKNTNKGIGLDYVVLCNARDVDTGGGGDANSKRFLYRKQSTTV